MDWKNLRKASVKLIGVTDDFQTGYDMKKGNKHHPYSSFAQSAFVIVSLHIIESFMVALNM
jgi:hypothetical protein